MKNLFDIEKVPVMLKNHHGTSDANKEPKLHGAKWFFSLKSFY